MLAVPHTHSCWSEYQELLGIIDVEECQTFKDSVQGSLVQAIRDCPQFNGLINLRGVEDLKKNTKYQSWLQKEEDGFLYVNGRMGFITEQQQGISSLTVITCDLYGRLNTQSTALPLIYLYSQHMGKDNHYGGVNGMLRFLLGQMLHGNPELVQSLGNDLSKWKNDMERPDTICLLNIFDTFVRSSKCNAIFVLIDGLSFLESSQPDETIRFIEKLWDMERGLKAQRQSGKPAPLLKVQLMYTKPSPKLSQSVPLESERRIDL